jgi:chromosome segregation ATPase
MKRATLIKTMFCFLALASLESLTYAQTTSSQDDQNLTTLVGQLSAEVKTLKRELTLLQIESQQGKVTRLERELKQARRERQQMEQAEKEFNDEIARLDARLSQSVSPDELADLNAERAAVTIQSPDKIAAKRQQFEEREAELSERLQHEQERLQELLKSIRQ